MVQEWRHVWMTMQRHVLAQKENAIISSFAIFQKRSFTMGLSKNVCLSVGTGRAFDSRYVRRHVSFLGLIVSGSGKIEQEGRMKMLKVAQNIREVQGVRRILSELEFFPF